MFADPATQTSKSVPLALRDALTAFEAGESMCSVEIGDPLLLRDEADASRQRLVDEPPNALRAERSVAGALQAVVRNRIGQIVPTGRLGPGENDASRLDGVAVHRTRRGNSHGAAVVRALEAAALERGDRELVLDVPTGAERFFGRLGYTVRPGSPANAPGFHPTLHRFLR